jgi:predicted SprT family Zn-dependent metalloprotease
MGDAAEALSAELEASLLRELMRAWRDLNHTFFKGAMKPPVLRLSDSASLLGRWDLATRAMELSRAMVLEQAWGSVVEVLKHEMAHQYVSEVLQAVDESAHGPTFRQVCARIGIDDAASGSPASADPRRARLLERVAGLLALAKSPNRNEAQNAAALAQRMMLKHNIAISRETTRASYGFRYLGEPKGRLQEHEHILAAIIAGHFFVEAIWVPAYRPKDGKRGSVLEVCGTLENLEMAGYAHAFLCGTAERLWKEHKKEQRIDNNRDRRSYLAGVMEGFRERLSSEKNKNSERGLVWLGDADLAHYQKKRHPYMRSVRLRGHGYSEARSHGRAAGRNIVLSKGVSGRASSRGKLLGPAKR